MSRILAAPPSSEFSGGTTRATPFGMTRRASLPIVQENAREVLRVRRSVAWLSLFVVPATFLLARRFLPRGWALYAAALADEGTVGRAAIRLRLTQSAVSKRIAALENELDKELVERQGGTVTALAAVAIEENDVTDGYRQRFCCCK